jgi:hypothetical protein
MPKTAIGFADDDETGECPECGAEIYLIVDRCPKCGYWFEEGDRPAMKSGHRVHSELQIVKWGAAVLFVLLLVGLLVGAVMSR